MILVSRTFAVNPNEHVSGNPFMHEQRGSEFGHNFVVLGEVCMRRFYGKY